MVWPFLKLVFKNGKKIKGKVGCLHCMSGLVGGLTGCCAGKLENDKLLSAIAVCVCAISGIESHKVFLFPQQHLRRDEI